MNYKEEVILSVHIEKIISYRNHILELIEQAIDILNQSQSLSFEIGGGKLSDWEIKLEKYGKEDILKRVKKINDRSIWNSLMSESGMFSLMDTQARDEWEINLDKGDFPEITRENIESSFEQLSREKNDIFERGIINIFKNLSWDYKTNIPCKFGKKIIMNYLVNYDGLFGFRTHSSGSNKLDDLERVLNILDGVSVKDYRNGVGRLFDEHVRNSKKATEYKGDYFSVRYFKKGTGHILFNRLDLLEKLNDIIICHYPNALPERV
ncbi:restriction endonuclease subunit M [Photorhabdus luminescens subsp. mexicana]|uniref:Restriction endonuclease subunit M n=2 Tax=Photorhabdus luminescens TaxID=29488 RepID=A0A4R4IYD8_PHOLU|nr:restriction endonuclease subunit M [Photorhabdus luminescens subsp. mexicana]